MEVVKKLRTIAGSFSVAFGLLLLLCFVSFAALEYNWFTDENTDVLAAVGTIDPNANGTVAGTLTTCGVGGNFDCLNDAVRDPSAPSGTGDYVTYANNQQAYYQMSSLTGVSAVTQVQTKVYHQEQNGNMAIFVSLWDATETTQYGTEVQFTNRTTAQWDTATFSGLSLTQAQLDGLRVRLRCARPGGGQTSTCRAFAMYADLTFTEAVDVIVSTTGTQQNLDAGATNAHVGGALVISEETSSRNITSITIAETGTINAAGDLSSVRLYYEQVADCSVASYNGTESQFGSATTFNGSNLATFTGSVSLSTATDMCVYVVVNVATSANAADTIEIQITSPASNIVAGGSPVISPATAVAIAGTTNVQKTVLTQTHYHWRNDDGSETAATSATGGIEDSPFIDFPRNVQHRLRFAVSNEGNKTSAATQYRIEYANKVTTCGVATGWTDVGAGGGDWDMATSPNIADGDTTNIASGANGAVTDDNITFVGTGALRETTSLSGSITLTNTQFTELEYTILATTNAADGQSYCFRVTSTGTPIDAYIAYPEASIASDLLVTATSTQLTNISIPTTGQYLGGGFVITDSSAGAHTISSITLTASGTVDVQNDISNIKLWYETDVAAPYDCTGELFDGDETQFGSTALNFNGSNQVVYTGSVSVSPLQGVCLYVAYDVGSGANNGETLDVFLDNAASDIVIGTGSIAPAAAVAIPGMTTFVEAHVIQASYHWRNNDGTEAGATSATAGVQDTPYLEYPDTTVTRLRFGVANTGGQTATNYQFRLEGGQRLTTCEDVSTWADINSGLDDWEIVASQLVDGDTTINISDANGGLTDVGTFVSVAGQEDTSSQTGNISIAANSFAEIEYSLRALSTVQEGASFCFRLTNAGTDLDSYTSFGQATVKLGTDYAVYRGVTVLAGGTTDIVEGVDYDLQFNDATRAFIRITNSHHTGGGPAAGSTGNNNADNVTAYISNPNNLASGITFARSASAGSDTRITWEVVEYIGASGGENEFVVRSASTATYVAANTTLTTGAVGGVVDDADVAVFITGQYNPDAGRADYNTGLSTAAWDSAGNTVTFTRGEAGADAVQLSYAVVEFTGANWRVQRSENTYAAVGVTETEPITAVNSLSRAFIHAQHRAGAGLASHADYGHEVWLSSIGAVSYRLNGAASTPTGHVSVAWVIENTQTTGARMVVTRVPGSTTAAGGGLTSLNVNIGKTLDDITVSSLFVTNSTNGTGNTFPEPMMSASIISDTQFNLQISDDGDAHLYRVEIVEWPTASRKLIQNDFRLYEDNDTLTPTVARGGLGENAEMTALNSPLAPTESVRIRMNLTVTAAAMPPGVDTFQLQYAERPPATACSAVSTWLFLGDTSSTTALWRGQAGTPTNGSTIPSLLLSASTIRGTYDEGNPTALVPFLALVNDVIEYDWNIQHNGAADKTDYCFRMVESDGAPLENYETYPLVRTVGYGPVLSRWQFFDDETSITPSASLAPENTTPSGIDNADTVKLRVSLAEQAGAPGNNVKFKVQFSEYPDFTEAFDVAATSTCLANSLWCYADGAGVDNAIIQNAVLSDTFACVGGAGVGCGTFNEGTSTVNATFDHQAYTTSEFEFTLQNAGARVNAIYYFRLVNLVEDELVLASTSLPSVLAASSSITATSSSVTAGITVDGHTSDVATTPTLIPFGEVPFNAEYVAIQRLEFNTNSTEGYQVRVVTDQPMTNTYGSILSSNTGTNAAPTSWAAGCAASPNSCFGYHTSDDVLMGGSGRFAPDDSFAGLTTTPEEIIYTGIPGPDVHDIVYKLQVNEEQPSGDYRASITYIISPIY